MSTEALSSFPPQERVALADLVETESPDASRAFVALATRHATEVGGRRVLANETLVPMTIPAPESTQADEATRLLVVSEYPTTDACRTALSKRKESMSGPPGGAIRTYATRPWSKVQATVIQTIMKGRGLFGRRSVPRLDGNGGAEALESLVRGSAIHGELPEIGIEDARWSELVLRAADRPIWMLNFLSFRPTAIYPDHEAEASGSSSISGARAYARYGQGMFRSITRVGGHVAWTSRQVEVLPDTHDAGWDQIAIAYYPSMAAMLTMLGDPDYQAAHVHREAGLARTRLVATQPLAGV
jgi:uncharacterized protein (DUF1330 family)